jgi:peptide/nickel transport system substrate-binding protein
MTRGLRFFALVAAVRFAAACTEGVPAGAGSPAGDPVAGGTAVVAAPGDLTALNALVATDRYSQEVLRHVLFLPLVRFDEGMDYVPALARSWELLGDTGIVFRLRTDVRWHDGARTTAADVAFTFRRAKDPATGFPNADYFAHWTAVEVIDSATVRFRFAPHDEPLAGLPFMPVMPRHLLDTIPAERLAQAAFNKRPVGNGPFRFVEYRPGDRWVFEASPDFPQELGGRPYLDRLLWRVIPDGTAQVAELQSGNADLALGVRAEQIAALDAQANLRAVVRRSRNYGFIAWNARRPPLDDVRVRRALSMAINRRRMIDALRSGYGELAVGPVGPFHWAFDSTLSALPFDPEAARGLLREAGLRDTDGDGDLDHDRGEFTIELKYQADTGMNRDLAELVIADLAAVGVTVAPRPTEWSVLLQDITSPARSFDAVMTGWSADYRLGLRDLFHSASRAAALGFAGYANPEVDSLIEVADTSRDRRAALPALRRIQRILRDEQPWTFLYYFPDLYVVSDRLHGFEVDERGALITVARWWIPAELQSRTAQPRSDSAARSPTPDSAPPR